MKMTREEAIRSYVENLSGDDLAQLLQHMNAYDGCFEEVTYYDMDSFDELMLGHTPSEIAQMIFYGGSGFNPNDEYFRFDAYGNLESANWRDVVSEALDLVDDIIDHLTHYYSGDTLWPDLDYLINADDGAIFNEDYEEVDEGDDDDGDEVANVFLYHDEKKVD